MATRRDLLKAAKRGEVQLHACFVTLAEAQYILTYDLGADRARRLVAAIKKFPIRWLHSDDALCASAADVKAQHKLSLADAFIAASRASDRRRRWHACRTGWARCAILE